MRPLTGRRSVLTAAAATLVVPALPARAQARRRIRFTAVFSDQDIRAGAMRGFKDDLAAEFDDLGSKHLRNSRVADDARLCHKDRCDAANVGFHLAQATSGDPHRGQSVSPRPVFKRVEPAQFVLVCCHDQFFLRQCFCRLNQLTGRSDSISHINHCQW